MNVLFHLKMYLSDFLISSSSFFLYSRPSLSMAAVFILITFTWYWLVTSLHPDRWWTIFRLPLIYFCKQFHQLKFGYLHSCLCCYCYYSYHQNCKSSILYLQHGDSEIEALINTIKMNTASHIGVNAINLFYI